MSVVWDKEKTRDLRGGFKCVCDKKVRVFSVIYC